MTRLSDSGASHRPIRVLVALSVLILSGMSVVATTALPALAGPAGTCPQGYRPNESAKQGDSPYWVLTWGASACKLASGTVSISSAGRPVFVSGKAALDDSERAVSRDARSYISAVVRCYNSAGSVVWSIGSITNMWTGATGVNLYPRGLFLLSANNLPTGTYTCDLEVSNQGKVTNVASPPSAFYASISGSSFPTLTTHQGGVVPLGSPPEHYAGWYPDHVPADAWMPAGSTKQQVKRVQGTSPGTGTVTVISSTEATTCSFSSDQPPCGTIDPNKVVDPPLTATVTQTTWLWQLDSSGNICNAQHSSWTGTLNAVSHHYSIAWPLTATLSLSCTSTVVAKTEMDVSGGIGVHVSYLNTTVAYYWG